MDVQTFNCPTCGASISSHETVCRYCGSRLATIACANCFGLMFVGSKFCPHCGAAAIKPLEVGPALNCPDCRQPMKQLLIQSTPLQECQKCFGVWVAMDAFARISADRQRRSDVLSDSPAPPKMIPTPVRYRPCPQCGQLMNRFNFGHTSRVIIDKCADHGIWFDRGELQRVIDFIQSGGLELAKQQDWEEKTRALREAQAQEQVDQVSNSIAAQDPDSVSSLFDALREALRTRL